MAACMSICVCYSWRIDLFTIIIIHRCPSTQEKEIITNWQCHSVMQDTIQRTIYKQHQITVSTVHIFIQRSRSAYLTGMESLPLDLNSKYWHVVLILTVRFHWLLKGLDSSDLKKDPQMKQRLKDSMYTLHS